MYTGIVQFQGEVTQLDKKPGLYSFTVSVDGFTEGIERGASVSVDGTCFTVVEFDEQSMRFDAMQETLDLTTIGGLEIGSKVNLERSARQGDEIGGHILSGHVTGMAEIVKVEESENNKVVTFQVPIDWMKYILSKGFIALDGCSLTVVNAQKETGIFEVHFIPETLERTTFGWKVVGDHVNLEIDSRTQAIVDTVEAYMEEHK